ncbi:hypothetical protein GF357_00640 [Candidatus Dojkabacteria bacterium]|nr:hypothetical protein [Candidatus Dojkabacteria bacterium]
MLLHPNISQENAGHQYPLYIRLAMYDRRVLANQSSNLPSDRHVEIDSFGEEFGIPPSLQDCAHRANELEVFRVENDLQGAIDLYREAAAAQEDALSSMRNDPHNVPSTSGVS